MGGVVKAVTGGGSKPAPTPEPTPKEPAKKATRAETVAAQESLAAKRSRGFGRGLMSYSRTLGSASPLTGEDVVK